MKDPTLPDQGRFATYRSFASLKSKATYQPDGNSLGPCVCDGNVDLDSSSADATLDVVLLIDSSTADSWRSTSDAPSAADASRIFVFER
jgi:hypothetical protein